MLRQGAPVREFTDAAALQAHYRALRERTWALRTVRPRQEHGRTRALVEAQRERVQREAQEREAAALAARSEMDARVFQVLDPEQTAREPKRIIARVAEAFGFAYADILSFSQVAPLVRARWAAIVAVREARPDLSFGQLGRAFDRDPTGIRYALRRVAVLGVPQPPVAREPERIIDDVAAAFGITRAEIIGPGKTAPLIRARWAAIAAVRAARPDLPLVGLGRLFGDRDHTTIRNALLRMAVEGVPQPPCQGGCT
ncbi:dnaA protein helix-turn-helix [Methylobacterium sp. UNC378MF]|uniref:helix-turn-helix domain-containing protein n=1 Tax=Methylobacterium sp. UNC378MF TaxID=1502748 RepID=UPI000882B58A|nr:helix-turn-helix domain-containing protein [Methylobacterium sp. UNC378MF]SDA13099.1 dnaA protein helix-turn-helix [Methylobacterium sp. UNC378MF]